MGGQGGWGPQAFQRPGALCRAAAGAPRPAAHRPARGMPGPDARSRGALRAAERGAEPSPLQPHLAVLRIDGFDLPFHAVCCGDSILRGKVRWQPVIQRSKAVGGVGTALTVNCVFASRWDASAKFDHWGRSPPPQAPPPTGNERADEELGKAVQRRLLHSHALGGVKFGAGGLMPRLVAPGSGATTGAPRKGLREPTRLSALTSNW
jgi:hypothetical protein